MKYAQSVAAMNYFVAANKLEKLYQQGLKNLHLDIVDFEYVQTFGLSFDIIKDIKNRCDLDIDVHCMVAKHNVLPIAQKLHELNLNKVSFPVSQLDKALIKELKSISNFKLGLMIEAQDQVSDYQEFIKEAEFVVLMTIDKIGGTGQPFNPVLLQKVSEIRAIKKQIEIISDGGLRKSNYQEFYKSGVDVAVGGSIVNEYLDSNQNFMECWSQGFRNEK
ncbi:ribulose phosphate epimerase [Mycoplasma sp. Ms02]|uniref:ribulose phosphate epimerase n=1 Tax=Mycoplasma sp. Ms02 TaxID=353851 RepID=UPI001C8A35FC|nr:ribulose phosphate epimerase [Mycoplasma sp. Ms02]QZE12493.1 ribulose phosphate epimerase [Mycoplasma sp. Ms02]